MPTNRLLFLIFLLVLVGAVLYINYGPGQHDTETVTLSPKAYIERVQSARDARQAQPSDSRR